MTEIDELHARGRERRGGMGALPLDERGQRAVSGNRAVARHADAPAVGAAPEQREVLLLVALEDMTYADVSRALGIPIGTVMSRLSRGRERLRRAMSGEPVTTPLRIVQ